MSFGRSASGFGRHRQHARPILALTDFNRFDHPNAINKLSTGVNKPPSNTHQWFVDRVRHVSQLGNEDATSPRQTMTIANSLTEAGTSSWRIFLRMG